MRSVGTHTEIRSNRGRLGRDGRQLPKPKVAGSIRPTPGEPASARPTEVRVRATATSHIGLHG
jgi:hypothetical protein